MSTQRLSRLRRVLTTTIAAVGVPALSLVAGCGDDDSSGDGGSTSTSTSTSTDTGVGTSTDTGNGTSTATGTSSGTSTTTATGTGTAPDTYPPGPYGTDEGDVLGYLEMEGYLTPMGANPGASTPVTMLDIKNSGSSHVLLYLAAMF